MSNFCSICHHLDVKIPIFRAAQQQQFQQQFPLTNGFSSQSLHIPASSYSHQSPAQSQQMMASYRSLIQENGYKSILGREEGTPGPGEEQSPSVGQLIDRMNRRVITDLIWSDQIVISVKFRMIKILKRFFAKKQTGFRNVGITLSYLNKNEFSWFILRLDTVKVRADDQTNWDCAPIPPTQSQSMSWIGGGNK